MAYVYAIVVDGVVRYIGKGSAKGGKLSRFHDHMRAMRRLIRRRIEGVPVKEYDAYTLRLASALAHEWLDGAIIEEAIIADGLSNASAIKREYDEIARCLKGQLWNIDGYAPRKKPDRRGHSSETRAKMSKSAKAFLAKNPRIVGSRLGKKASEETRKRCSVAQKKRFASSDVPRRHGRFSSTNVIQLKQRRSPNG